MPDRPRSRRSRWWALLGRPTAEPEPDIAELLERELAQAREQHQLITDQAAAIVAGQHRAAARLDQAIDDYERTTAEAQRALLLARTHARAGRPAEAADQERIAEARAARLVRLERDMDERKEALLEATAASDAARAAVSRSAALLRDRANERDRLSTRLAQARLQEQVNAARQALERPDAPESPSLDEVRRTIEARLESARALAELRPEPIDETRVRFDQELAEAEARTRLDALRGPLGLDEPDSRVH